MDLVAFLAYLHAGAPSTFALLVSYLSNGELKAVRLACASSSASSASSYDVASALHPYLFRRVYLSAHAADLAVFGALTTTPANARLCRAVNELVWDDTIFDRWVNGLQTYTDRLDSITPLPRHVLRRADNAATIAQAYGFWRGAAAAQARARADAADRRLFEAGVAAACFPNLRQITVLSRSRLTYVDLDKYWERWQTPRSRAWRQLPFARYLIPPEPFKPSSGTTVRQSEGVRPVEILLDMLGRRSNDQRGLQLGALVVSLIGGGQTRASGGMNGNRYERKWHIDLAELTEPRRRRQRRRRNMPGHDDADADYANMLPARDNRVTLHLLIEQQTEDMFRQENLWETLIDQLLQAGADTLEHLTLSNICLDWFWEYLQTHRGTMLDTCRALTRVDFEGGWCQNPADLLKFLRTSTAVREVSITSMDVEGTSLHGVLQDLRQANISFDHFDVRRCRCPAETAPYHLLSDKSSWTAPWDGPSDKIVPWLNGDLVDFPLSQQQPS